MMANYDGKKMVSENTRENNKLSHVTFQYYVNIRANTVISRPRVITNLFMLRIKIRLKFQND